MNLEESNEVYQKNKQKNAKKKTILGGIVLCIIIIVVCLVAIVFLKQLENSRFKLFVNDKEATFNQNLLQTDEDGKNYINIKMLANYTGYKYTQGDYIEVNEDKNSCYLENDFEIVTFKANETSFSKYIKNKNSTTETSDNDNTKESKGKASLESQKPQYVVKSKDREKENYVIKNPIKVINEQLYIPVEAVYLAYNSTVTLTEKSLQIRSMDYLVKYGQKSAGTQGYTTISSTYENLRAIANNMLVIGRDNSYGVISLKDGTSILSVRYDDIKYVQSEDKFYVYLDSKVGIMDSKGNTIISPKDYEAIENFDINKKLYLVKQDNQYGIVNSNGETILHTDFDVIGLSDINSFKLDDLENQNLWFDHVVAVKKGSMYGLYNIEDGNEIAGFTYEGLGYKTKTADTLGEESTLIIPKSTGVEGIVVSSNGLYGIYDINVKKEVIPCLCSRIYAITNNGITKYYMEFNGNQLEMREYFEAHNMITAK